MLIADISLRLESEAFVNSAAVKAGPKVAFQQTDVTDWAQLDAAFDEAERAFGSVPDLVCPGAGIYEPVTRYSPPPADIVNRNMTDDSESLVLASGQTKTWLRIIKFWMSTCCTRSR